MGKKVQDEVSILDQQLAAAIEKKNHIESNALSMKRKMDAANRLLLGLSGENQRWTEDSKNFALRRKNLVGDIALACAFVTYSGPFNSEYREKINRDLFLYDMHNKIQLPGSTSVDLVNMLIDQGTIAEWTLEGLPADDLSVQNGIMVTRSSRYPLMIDP